MESAPITGVMMKGYVIFISLLPFIIKPVIGALSIRWLFIGDGILTAFLEWWLERDIALFAQGWTIELLMLFYRVWHSAPFAFVVLYAGLQTINQDSLESAIIDGANRLQRLRFIIVPHLMPLIIFIALIHLMDAYRVFDEIVGFSSQAHVISLQWLTYDLLTPDAFVSGIMEGKEWVWEGGILREQLAEKTAKKINTLVDQNKLEEHKLGLFQDFLANL